jgi:hypothetical protein
MNENPSILDQKVSSEDSYVDEYELVSRKDISNSFNIKLALVIAVVSAITSIIFHYLKFF